MKNDKIYYKKSSSNKTTYKKKPILVNILLVITLVIGIINFIITITSKNNTISEIITNLIITLFTICFSTININYKKKNKNILILGSLLLIAYLSLNINNTLNKPKEETNFEGKNLVSIIKWANKNNITLEQDYEYSDIVPEYKIITEKNKNNKIQVSISEGPNPSKEIIVPSMIGWNTERVIKYVKDNHLSNVEVEFIESDKEQNTVIDQSTSGNLKRDDNIKLTFSYGEELGYNEVNIIDFTNKSKFEIEFYMKEHQLNYKIDEDYSNKIKKGYGTKQNIKPNTKVKVNDEEITVTISKGPKIKVPNLKKMNLDEITEWVIKNKLKLKFTDKYDDSIKKGSIIRTSHNKGDILTQGDEIEITLSKGTLKMPKFNSLDDFINWANKYDIKYEEDHVFSNDVEKGKVISYSYKTGEIIKNNDTIIVKISDGKKVEIPNLKGLTKKEASKKLEKLNIKYNFIYKNSNSDKDTVIDQSIKAGQDTSDNITITITLSNGKEEKEETKTNKRVNSSTITRNTTRNNTQNQTRNKPEPSKKPENTCENVTVYLQPGDTYDRTVAMTNKANPKIKFTYSKVRECSNGSKSSGTICNSNYDGDTLNTCETYNLVVVG